MSDFDVFVSDFERFLNSSLNADKVMIIEYDQSNRMLNDFDAEIELNLNN